MAPARKEGHMEAMFILAVIFGTIVKYYLALKLMK
jgi:hypothetical protein